MTKVFCYMPLLRTRSAELVAYNKLSNEIASNVLPVFELTRARRTKADGEGDINKNIEIIKEIAKDRWFALDLTTTYQQSNRVIGEILSGGGDGFTKWVELIRGFSGYNIIPAIHIDYNHINLLNKEVDALRESCEYLLLRISITDDPDEVIYDFLKQVNVADDIILILDREYIDINDDVSRAVDYKMYKNICSAYGSSFHSISYSSSSFPSSVVKPGYGKDEHGYFRLPETTFFKKLVAVKQQAKTCYSDYATVHPLFYPGGAGGWVPRVDFPLGTELFYYRFRREDGGYIRASSLVIRDKMYRNYGDWGCSEIETASIGLPNGKNPAHWISVRMSLHMARQVERLVANADSHLEL